MTPKIWINFDPNGEDLSVLTNMLTEAEIEYHMELVANDDEDRIWLRRSDLRFGKLE